MHSRRARLIDGHSADLLPWLAVSSYNLTFLDGDPLGVLESAEEILRLLRLGNIPAVVRTLAGGRVAGPARRKNDVVTIRNLSHELISSPGLETSIVPVGEDLLVTHLL